MKHTLMLLMVVLAIGLSISGGPVVWAVLVMLSPLAIFLWLGRTAHDSAVHARPVVAPPPRRPTLH
jgi:hypothetical protein